MPLFRGDVAAGIWGVSEVSQGKDAPDGAGGALGSRSDSPLSKETDITDAVLLSCKIKIFIHYVDPSDSDPCPRRADILYKASPACTQLDYIPPASESMQSIQSTSKKLPVAKFGRCWQMVCGAESVANTTGTHVEVNYMHKTEVNKSCSPGSRRLLSCSFDMFWGSSCL